MQWLEPWSWGDTLNAHRLWLGHVAKKRAGLVGKRPVADVFVIEAFAQRFQGLITRNAKHFSTVAVVIP